mmetsp:Transcript_26109/g.44566  ORF Transcript_26109/g.44566 Transcript_26109/m.44566 type:complete len:244 (-) Transcript_26109:297-1028(-)
MSPGTPATSSSADPVGATTNRTVRPRPAPALPPLPPPSLPLAAAAITGSLSSTWMALQRPGWTVTPSRFKAASTNSRASRSSLGSTDPTRVTFVPSRANACASSHPMGPPPSTTSPAGRASSPNPSSLLPNRLHSVSDVTHCTVSKPSMLEYGTTGWAPTQRMNLAARHWTTAAAEVSAARGGASTQLPLGPLGPSRGSSFDVVGPEAHWRSSTTLGDTNTASVEVRTSTPLAASTSGLSSCL